MIQIKYQDAFHQYDSEYNPITTWDNEKCEWIVNAEYEDVYYNNEIDWSGNNNNFPRGITKNHCNEYFKRKILENR